MEGPLRRCQPDLPKLLGSCKGHWQDFIRISTTFAHKDLYKALVMIFIYHGTLRRHHTTFARSSYRTFPRTQKIFLHLFTVISGKQLKSAPPHNEGDTTCARRLRERYQNQREWSDKRRFLEDMLDFHQNCARHETWALKISNTMLFTCVSGTFGRGLLRLPQKWIRGTRCYTELITMSRIKNDDNFITRDCPPFEKSSKFCTCREKGPPKPPPILTCLRFSNV